MINHSLPKKTEYIVHKLSFAILCHNSMNSCVYESKASVWVIKLCIHWFKMSQLFH